MFPAPTQTSPAETGYRSVKLIVQIPCFNEEEYIAETLAQVPRRVEGFDEVETLIVDDGSDDRTVEVARAAGADHVVRHTTNLGLARAFRTGIEASLRLGADVIVNTDADNQYPGRDIPAVVGPIVAGKADIVVGDRRPGDLKGFSPWKRVLQRLGSAVVRRLSSTSIPDAVSGFRAFTRQAAMQINIISDFSYTIEMLIQAGHKGMAVTSVPIGCNPSTRPSRLFRSVPQFLWRSLVTMLRTYTMNQPLKVFSLTGALLISLGFVPIGRFLYHYLTTAGGGKVQSLVLGGVLITVGVIVLTAGVVADLIDSNRKLIEILLERVWRLELIATQSAESSGQKSTMFLPVGGGLRQPRAAPDAVGVEVSDSAADRRQIS